MPAKTSVSWEFECTSTIVEDLLQNITERSPNAVGLLICDSSIDYSSVISKLSEELPFPVVGGTTLTFPISSCDKGQDLSASLTVFNKDSMCYSLGISDVLDESKAPEQMKAIYDDCLRNIPSPAKLIMPFFPMMPGVITDKFVNSIFKLAKDVPVFGGVMTNDLIGTKAAVFANGRAMHDKMVLLVLGGEIEPVFAVGSQVTCMSELGPSVTSSTKNIVYKVGDMSFCDYLSSLGVSPADRVNGVDALLQYGPLPVLIKNKRKIDDGIPEIRCISHTDIITGSAAFSSDIPEGCGVNLGILHKEDVRDSAEVCLNELLGKIDEKQKVSNYSFEVLFCISCVARYFALVGGDNLERQLLDKEIPVSLPYTSYYGFCEIGPTYDPAQKTIINRSHNASIIMCSF